MKLRLGVACLALMVCSIGVTAACRGRIDVPGDDGCVPHEQELCYTGPPGTDGVGPCRPGLHTCADDGSGFGPCEGEVLPGVEDCSAPGDEDCDGKPAACTGDTLWARRYTGTGNHYARSLAVDPAGNAAIGAELDGDLELGPPVGVVSTTGDSPACVFQISAEGDPVFAVVIDGHTFWMSVAADAAGNTYGAVNFGYPITFGGETITPDEAEAALVFELDAAAGVEYQYPLAATDYLLVRAVGASPGGDFLIAGNATGIVDVGSGSVGANGTNFVTRFDPAGKPHVVKAFDASGVQTAIFDADGNILLAGWFSDTVDFGGDTLVSQGQEDSFVVKLGPSGEHIWSKRFGSSGVNHSHNLVIAAGSQGHVYLTGYFSDTWDLGGGPVTAQAESDAYLVQLDANGNYVWGRYFGNGHHQFGTNVTVDSSGNPIIAVMFDGSIDLGAGVLQAASPLELDLAIAKLTPEGETLWSKRFGDGSHIWPSGLATDAAGHVYVAGSLAGSIDFGTGALPATGKEDIFLAKLSP